jgi:hypothetical protein
MQGGGFFSSIGKAFKSVYKALKNTGVVDKAKQAALSKGRELGGQAIAAAAKRTTSGRGCGGIDHHNPSARVISSLKIAILEPFL